MKEYEVWEGDHYKYVSSWDTLEDALWEIDRLIAEGPDRDYFVRKNTPRGKLTLIRG